MHLLNENGEFGLIAESDRENAQLFEKFLQIGTGYSKLNRESKEKIKARYKKQLEFYAMALQNITSIKVVHQYIYLYNIKVYLLNSKIQVLTSYKLIRISLRTFIILISFDVLLPQ